MHIRLDVLMYPGDDIAYSIPGNTHAHLAYADGSEEIFTDKAMDEIYKYSAGSARAINKVCTHSLLSAAQRNKKLIDDHMVHMVIESELP